MEFFSPEAIIEWIMSVWQQFMDKLDIWSKTPSFYIQAVIVVVLIIMAYGIGERLRKRVRRYRESKGYAEGSWLWYITRTGRLISPLLLLIFLSIAEAVASQTFDQSLIVSAVRRVALVWLLWVALNAYVMNPFVQTIGKWLLVPTAFLQLFGYFEPVTAYLDGMGFTFGEIRISALTVCKTLLFASVLLWVATFINQRGEEYIRGRQTLNLSTRELLVKSFQIVVYATVFLLTLNLIGIDLTALAVFGGALGVGLGFGLQKIASNFISGIILLMERSIRIGNLVELDNGTFGHLRKLGARASIVETFDGKEVMVPNEDFITSRVINWTYSNDKTRIDIDFGVSYECDIHQVPELAKEAALTYTNLADKNPRCWLKGYGDSSVDFMLSFWVNNLGNGVWEPRSYVLFELWDRLKAAGIEIPFPQRDIHIRSGLSEALHSDGNPLGKSAESEKSATAKKNEKMEKAS